MKSGPKRKQKKKPVQRLDQNMEQSGPEQLLALVRALDISNSLVALLLWLGFNSPGAWTYH